MAASQEENHLNDLAPIASRPRLLFLIGQLGVGGSERQLLLLTRYLRQHALAVEVAVWGSEVRPSQARQFRSFGITLHELAAQVSRMARLWRLCVLSVRVRPAILHSFSLRTNPLAWFTAMTCGAVPVGSFRTDYASVLEGSVVTRLYQAIPRCIIFNSEHAYAAALRARSALACRLPVLVRNAVDVVEFSFSRISTDCIPLISGVGSLRTIKRWDRLLHSLAQVQSTGTLFQAHIAGTGPDLPNLLSLTRALGLEKRVAFLGHCNDVHGLLRRCWFLVHTSEAEGCPNAVLEAMATGRPVIAMQCGEVTALIQDGVSGYIVPQDATSTLTDRIVRLLRDPELCKRMGEAARRRIEGRYTIEAMARGTLRAYRLAGWENAESHE